MKILFLIRELGNGGAERQLALLANELGRRGHSVSIGVFYSGGCYERTLSPDRVRMIDLKKSSRWNMVGLAAKVLRVVGTERPDVIHGYLSAGNLAATLGQLAWPAGQLVWGIRDSRMDAKHSGWVTRLASRLLFMASKRAQLMIFNSQAAFEHWASAGYAAKYSVCVPNGIDVTEFAPDRDAGARFREQCGIPANVPLVGMVARLDPAKDHPGFLKAAAKVIKTVPEARFLCLGEGPAADRKRLQTLAADLGIADRVVWPAATRAMRGVYNSLDVFCLASHAEGFPNVVAEAMACGRQCVVTDAGDAAFVVGGAGSVVPLGDSNALAAAIVEALARSGARSAAPRQRIIENFAIEALAARTEEALVAHRPGTGARPVNSTA